MISFSKIKATAVSVLCNVVALMVIACTVWVIGNHMQIVSPSPEKAAIKIAQKYETRPAGDYLALTDGGAGRERTYFIARDGSLIAQVTISDFLGLGWQEHSYERL